MYPWLDLISLSDLFYPYSIDRVYMEVRYDESYGDRTSG